MATNLFYNEDYNKASFGFQGMRQLSSGETSAGGEKFLAIQVVSDAQIDFTSAGTGGDTTITNLNLEAGMTIYGNLTAITVDSGKIIAYLQ